MVMWAEVQDIGGIYIEGETIYDLIEDDSIVIERDFIHCEMEVGIRGDNSGGADRYEFCIYPLSKASMLDVGDGRGYYLVEEFTVGTFKKTIREIKKTVNNIWGNNWHEIAARISWYAVGETEYVFEAKEPVLNSDGTINYHPSAYRGNSFMSQGIEAARKGLN